MAGGVYGGTGVNMPLLLYESLLLPHLDYCDTVYSLTSAANLQILQTLQNSACRTMLRVDRRAPVDEMHSDLKIMTLEQRRVLHIFII